MEHLNEYAEVDEELRQQSLRLDKHLVEWTKHAEYLQNLLKEHTGVDPRNS